MSFFARAYQLRDGDPESWYVYWEKACRGNVNYGSRGNGLTESEARSLADRMNDRGRWDAM